MEVAVIDWSDSKFVKDDLYEYINAPQWVDFSVPNDSVDDESWFCRPDCNHPKTIDDFIKVTPTSKLLRSASVLEILPFGDRNRRDAALKKRVPTQPSFTLNKESKCDGLVEDAKNLNPNLSNPPSHIAKFMKEAFKSSTEKKKVNNFLQKEETPRLKSTLSARNLFAGRDILNQITDFCNELKRIALREKERENVEKENAKSPLAAEKHKRECSVTSSGALEERKPLLEVSKDKCEAIENISAKEKQQMRKKRNDEAENTPPICVDLNNIRSKQVENLSQIRIYPPSPQCFSANRGRASIIATPKAFKPRPLERVILQQLEQSSNKEETGEKCNHGKNVSVAVEREADRTLDVFWFLKPCTQ